MRDLCQSLRVNEWQQQGKRGRIKVGIRLLSRFKWPQLHWTSLSHCVRCEGDACEVTLYPFPWGVKIFYDSWDHNEQYNGHIWWVEFQFKAEGIACFKYFTREQLLANSILIKQSKSRLAVGIKQNCVQVAHTLLFLPRVGVPGRERLLLAAEAFALWFILDRLELFFPCSNCCSAPRQSRTSSTHNGEEEYGTDVP